MPSSEGICVCETRAARNHLSVESISSAESSAARSRSSLNSAEMQSRGLATMLLQTVAMGPAHVAHTG